MIKIFSLQISKWSLLLLLGDIAAFCLAIPLGMIVLVKGNVDHRFILDTYSVPLLMVGGSYIFVLYVSNLYNHYLDFRRRENISQVILSCLVGTVVAMFAFCYPSWQIIPRSFVEWHAVGFVWLTTLWRFCFSALALPVRLRRQVLVVGAGAAGRWIAAAIRERPNCGLAVIGFTDDDPNKLGTTIDGLKVLELCSKLIDIVKQHKVGLIVVAMTYEKSSSCLIALNRAFMNGCQLMDVPALYEFLTGEIPIDHISDMWLYFNSLSNRNLHYPRLKRIMDLVLAAVALLFTWPLFLIIGLAIKLDTQGPIIFRQKRLGFNGKPFQILKFRTMVAGEEGNTPKWASVNDQRITRVGRLLRKAHLDELPQLINILKGEMSLIGPRAEWDVFAHQSQELVAEWRPGRRASDPQGLKVLTGHREQIPYYSYRLLVKPGVTGWAQVNFPHAGSSLEEMKMKLQYDLYYIKNMGFLLDIAILMKTIRIVLFGHGK